jgi:hypothetical protein
MSIDIPIISSFVDKGISDAIRQFKQLETASDKAQFAIKKAAVPAAAALAGIASLAANAVKQASNLSEAQNKANVIFKDAAKDITKFADTASTKLGQSKTQALNAAATFGSFGKAAGLAGADLSKFATGFTTLASDLASFNNTTPEEAVIALGAALRGEAEPIRRFNVLLDDATIKTEAMKLGIIKTTKDALPPQQKVLAVQSAILKQTSDQQGDFAKTSDGLANSQRILAAQIKDVSAQFGNALLPAIEKVLPYLKDFAKIAKENPDDVQNLAIGITAMAAATVALNIATKTNPFILMAAAILVADKAMDKLLDKLNKIGGYVGVLGKIFGSLAFFGFAGKVFDDVFLSSGNKIENSTKRTKAAIEATENAITKITTATNTNTTVTTTNTTATDKQTEAEKRGANALSAKKKAIEDYLTAYKDYAESISGTITGLVSLSDAVNKVQSGESENVGAAFKKQIEDAKGFANNLKTLISQGLGQAGLAQLLNLGPVAGLQVTDEMILGTMGIGPRSISVGSLNADLAGLQEVSAGLGGAAAGAFMGKGGGGAGVNITVNTGVGDPVAIGKGVVDALNAYRARTGSYGFATN